MMKQDTKQWMITTPVGPVYLVASAHGLRGTFWTKQKVPMARTLKSQEPQVKILSQAVSQLREYFQGKRKSFNLPFDVNGTTFQKKAWNQLGKIPYGKTISYGQVAARIKNPKAVRAVGTANGKNPLCIIVPCHRVIAFDGSLGGFSGGLEVKVKLLKLEGISVSK